MRRRGRHGVVMTDVAVLAGVSQKTVSRVINDAPHVRPEVRDRVRLAIDQLGYRPNLAARALVTKRSHVIGVIAVGTTLFGPASRVFSLEHVARERGYELAVASLPDTSAGHFRAAVHSLLARGVEGIILEVPNHLIDIDDAIFEDVPLASSVGQIPGVRNQTVVRTDQVHAGYEATQHLLDLGHEKVWHIAGPIEWEAAQQRRRGWSAALANAHRGEPDVVQGDWSARSGYELGADLARRAEVTAVFTANDHQAMGLMRALAEAGKAIPADVSVVGFDDVPEAEYQMVPLTTVRTDHVAVSQRVLSELVTQIEGGTPSSTPIDLPCELVIRRSTGPPPSRFPTKRFPAHLWGAPIIPTPKEEGSHVP